MRFPGKRSGEGRKRLRPPFRSEAVEGGREEREMKGPASRTTGSTVPPSRDNPGAQVTAGRVLCHASYLAMPCRKGGLGVGVGVHKEGQQTRPLVGYASCGRRQSSAAASQETCFFTCRSPEGIKPVSIA